MSSYVCCFATCDTNYTHIDNNVVMYAFPKEETSDQRKLRRLWIKAIRRVNPDGSLWKPRPKSRICSKHFVGNRKNSDPCNFNSIPTIFPPIYHQTELYLMKKSNGETEKYIGEIKKDDSTETESESSDNYSDYETIYENREFVIMIPKNIDSHDEKQKENESTDEIILANDWLSK